ncbi:glycosyltransferase [Flavobacteriaceae bacterium]|jgi:glycosyltransferase involved in cell wall biosynthesis|nr:glycosyltransferase [Flavobacteriaceae bacterium]
MGIIFIEDSSKSLYGGGQKISSFCLKVLSSKYHINYTDFADNPMLRSSLNNEGDLCLKLLNRKGKNIFDLLINTFFIVPNILKFIKIFKFKNINVIYTTTKRSLLYGFILRIIFDKPYVYHAHMLMQGSRYDFIILYLIKKANKCICVSEYVEMEFKKAGLANTCLLRNPLENELKEKKLRTDFSKINIAFAGSVIEIKGVNFLLDILKYNFVEGVMIHVFGEGPELDSFKNKYINSKNIVFHGFEKNIIYYLDDLIDIIILPTIIPEAAPIIIQQAFSRGVPVITTNIGGQKIFIQNNYNGITVKPQNSFKIAKAVMKLKNDQKLYNQMSLNCLESSRKFEDLESFKIKLLDIINKT